MKKKSLLITLVALTLLSSMLLSSILGVTKAEYFKTLSKKLDFQASPDLALQYYLRDGSSTSEAGWKEKNGVYKSSKSFTQEIVVGRNDAYTTGIYNGADWARYVTVSNKNVLAYLDSSTNKDKKVTLNSNKYPEASNINMSVDNFKYNGENIVYQIKLPVDETGYYLLNFQVDFRLKTGKTTGDPWASEISGFYTQHYDRAIGCEILNHNDGFTFGDSSKPLDLYTRSQNDTVYYKSSKSAANKQQNRTFEADSLYQWKTLAPSRAENVSLAFKVEQQDVDKGYVIWMWDLAGLYGARTWRMEFTNLSVEKTMELNGSTKTRNSSVDPYFMFPQTSFMNNQYMLSLTDTSKTGVYDNPYFINENTVDSNVRSVDHQGRMSYSKGRGTFATAATANSLTFQAESLFYGFDAKDRSSATENYPGTTTKLKYQYLDEDDDAAYSNPVAVYIPLKNIQFDTDYKVTFDLSVARQGRYGIRTPSNSSSTSILGAPDALHRTKFYGYDDADNGFGPLLVDYANPFAAEVNGDLQNQIFRKGEQLFSSYLYSGDPSVNRNENAHKADGFTQIKYANKTYQNEPLTKYDEINSLDSFQHSVTQSVNNTYNNAYSQSGNVKHKAESRNWFNAVLHTEYNGQNEIHWVTFYNTTFSFNIDGSNENNKSKLTLDENGFIQDLNWVWAMDSLISGCYYRIKFENVRIEKVVKYTSSLHPNGIMIAGTQINPELHTVDDPSDNSKGFDATNDKDDLYNVVDTFRSFRGINGTGQNWQAKGFVLDDYTDSKVFTSEGNIYAPIIDASKFTVRPNDTTKPKDANEEYPPTADAYKIALSGFAVCKGGVEKYVFSVDGGLTWHDMTFSGTNATTEPDPEDRTTRNQLVLASRGVNQYVSGQTRYNATNFTNADLDISAYTHYNFTEADGANANFSNFTLVADLTEYKNEANLDVIIAAVPTENINYRCEILRIINFNQIKNYVNFPYDFVSDITVNNKDKGPSLLNAFRLDESHLPDKQKPHYHNGKANPEAIGFTMTKTYTLRDKRAQSTTAYARMGAISYDYEDIKTAFSDFPIYNELSITGWAIVEGGVQNYYWSADHGKTWTKCSGTAVKYTNSTDNDLISPSYADHYYSELGSEDPTIGKEKHRFEDSLDGNFSGSVDKKGNGNYSGTKLTADLSNYVGEVVDVIFAAKPNESDIYVPVGRIDNVGVYGANGTFYSRIHKVFIDGRTNDDLGGVAGATPIAWDSEYAPIDEKEYFNFADKWNIGYTADKAYTIFESQNVNPINARYINNEVQTIKSGGRVTIDGYVFCKGGVERYKYSLDGGITWTVINDAGTNVTKDSGGSTTMVKYAKRSDNSFTVTDGVKGDFCCTSPKGDDNYSGKEMYDHALEFNIPALKDGTERDLLVVAEGKYNKNIPVLHMKIRVQGGTKYGYHNIAGLGTYGVVQGGYFTGEQSLTFTPKFIETENGFTNNALNRITIPVTEAGEHQLTFNHTLENPGVTRSETKRQMYDESEKAQSKYTDFSLSVNKTHFMVGEAIKVDFSCKFNTATKSANDYGALMLYIISEDWVNDSGEQHAIRSKKYIPDLTDKTTTRRYSVDDIRTMGTENTGLAECSKDFKAGKYSIILAHSRGITLSDILASKNRRTKFIFAEIPIYIHDADEKVEFSVVHDEGDYTYFSDISRQFNSVGANKDANTEHIYTLTDPFRNADSRPITATVNVTDADVKRGYIVLDADYTNLLAGNEHTDDQCRDDYPEEDYPWGVEGNGENHDNEHCVSRDWEKSNGSIYTKKVFGDTMYTFKDDDPSNDILHTGIKYTVKFSLGEDALVKKTSGFLFDMPLMTAPTGYANAVFMNTATTAGDYELSVNPILNPPIHKGPFNNLNTFKGSYLSVPKTYFNVGEPITVDYNVAGATFTNKSVYMYITSDQECITGRYGDLYVKRVNITKNSTGRITFTADSYNLGDGVYDNGNVTAWTNQTTKLNNIRKLPAGEYKVWLINNNGSFDPYNAQRSGAAAGLMTEPITIKVIDPENPDLSIALSSNIPHGSNADHTRPEDESVPTEIILDRVVYEKGENVYFKINGSWVRNWVAILKHDVFTGGSASENKVGTWSRYAEHGTYDSIVTKNGNNNYLQTDTLEPGQYKIVYLFGLTVEGAWNHDNFAVHNNSLSKIMAIIDITILPEGTLQQHTVTYTKANGQQGKIDLGTNTLAQSIQTPTYTVVEVSSTEITDIMKNAAYSSTQGANYGTAASLKYRFGSYTVRPAEVTYTLTVPADIDNSTCNVAYYTTLENSGASKKFNILCPTYSFSKKSS